MQNECVLIILRNSRIAKFCSTWMETDIGLSLQFQCEKEGYPINIVTKCKTLQTLKQ